MAQALGEPQERLIEVEASEPERRSPAPAAEEKVFRRYDPDQVLLMSPWLAEWVPEGDLAQFVSDLVEEALDRAPIYAAYESERGYPPYDPRLMLKLLIYGYATGTCSSRKLERVTYRDVAVRMLCADQHPDYRSIARFRERHLEALARLFVEALRLCAEAGLVKLGALALDGTKLRANGSRHKAMSYERMERAEAELQAEVEALLADAEASDRAEDELYGPDRRGDELPAELAGARVASSGSVRPRGRSRPRPKSASRRVGPRWPPRAGCLARRRAAAIPSPPSRRTSATSPTPSRRS